MRQPDTVLDSLPDLARQIYQGYGPEPPIQIIPAVMTVGGVRETTYVVALSGSEFGASGAGQSLGVYQNAVTALEVTGAANPYLSAVETAMSDAIPAGSRVFFAGHSLGGAVAQLAGDYAPIEDRYEIVGGIGLGTPHVGTASPEGDWTYVGVIGDPVPLLSRRPFEAIRETRWEGGLDYVGRDLTGPESAHNAGYLDEQVWRDIGVTGTDRGATIAFDAESIQRYEAPNLLETLGVDRTPGFLDEIFAQASAARGLLPLLDAVASVEDRVGAVAQAGQAVDRALATARGSVEVNSPVSDRRLSLPDRAVEPLLP